MKGSEGMNSDTINRAISDWAFPDGMWELIKATPLQKATALVRAIQEGK